MTPSGTGPRRRVNRRGPGVNGRKRAEATEWFGTVRPEQPAEQEGQIAEQEGLSDQGVQPAVAEAAGEGTPEPVEPVASPATESDPPVPGPRIPGYVPDTSGTSAASGTPDPGDAAGTDPLRTVATDPVPEGSGVPWWLGQTSAQPVVEPPPGQSPRRRLANMIGLVLGIALAVVIVLAGVSVVRATRSSNPGVAASPAGGALAGGGTAGGTGGGTAGNAAGGAAGGGGTAPPPAHVASAPVGTTRAAEFQLASGVTTVIVRAVDLGDTLYRAVTPDASGFVPHVTQDAGRVQLGLTKVSDGDGTDTVVVELNRRVRWQVTMIGGSASATVDLRGAQVAGVDFVGGVARIELWLPGALGATLVRMSGGAREMTVHLSVGPPARVALDRGAATVTVDGATHSGIAAGTRFTPAGWEQAHDRYDVDAAGGVEALTVDRY